MTHLRKTLVVADHGMVGHRFEQAAIERGVTETYDVGGNGGANPAHARLLAGDLDTETLIRYLDRFLMYYIRTADRLQRTAPWVDSLDGGLDRVREVVVDDALGLGAELEQAMATHVGTYFDEWQATLQDPAKLARFVSFVNAPGTPDPNISFSTERGQIRPETSAEPVVLGATVPVGAP
jgi:nitrite reductase (NADH) large subunit